MDVVSEPSKLAMDREMESSTPDSESSPLIQQTQGSPVPQTVTPVPQAPAGEDHKHSVAETSVQGIPSSGWCVVFILVYFN